MSVADLVQLEPGTSAMRAPAMLVRLCRLEQRRAILRQAEHVLRKRIDFFQANTLLMPIPTYITTELQIRSIMTAMASLG